LTIISAHRHALAEGMWDRIGRALKESEQHRAFCAKNSNDVSCKPTPASTLLFLCESNTPESLGRCHGALHAYALDGQDLDAWFCVPKDTLQDYEQLRRIFIREGERMPEVLHRPARLLLYYAVAKAFPCPLLKIPPEAR
jgi:Rap1a immunity proteins